MRINQDRTVIRADIAANALPPDAWHRQSAGVGAKGPRYYDWAWVQTGPGGTRCLLIRHNPATGELAFCLCWSPGQVALSALVRVVGIRWCVEECFQAAKGQAGLDHYQVRHWTAWHRHITLAMLALAFLAAVATSTRPARSADPHRPARSGDPIDLTIPELRHLIGALFERPYVAVNTLLAWSIWRRRHQAQARRCHYRRRLTTCSPT